ncbi:FliM/FliN family flagellar motor switch protein [Sphingomonas sp. BIUV-7]|uniref:Flagellar motor switch protein FliM n=1 Tax=Sphingomonas natans TaxID=3063330 RepID=A0ABT8YDV8_9SPHN|nr:FliM/FliN family flagellar motor switch protein [Sphingomonas sp. BIUV-7]MDO6416529.1 FliM/FliN family flagellar motor switch protein [Sphingomonas sp. BIUV-7]
MSGSGGDQFGDEDVLSDGFEEAIAQATRPGPEVLTFALGSDSFRPAERLSGLERMGEKIARSLRTVIEPFVQVRTQVAAVPLTTRSFDEWLEAQPNLISLSHYRLQPMKGGMLIAIPADFVAALIERFYGGTAGPTAASAKRLEFSASEDLLLARLLEKVSGLMVEAWRDVIPVEATLAQRETSRFHIRFIRPDDQVVVQNFTITPAEGQPATITVLYPLAMLRPIEEQMSKRVHDDAPSGNTAWRSMLAASLAEVQMPVRSILARPEISLAQLMTLKPGDVIPIQILPRTPLLIASRTVAEGQIGEQDGRAAMLIERVG